MDFTLSSEQQALADSVTRYFERQYNLPARHAVMTSTEGISRDHWLSFAELGWLGAGLPEARGGYGGGAIENSLIMEHAGRGLVVEPLLPCAVVALQVLAALPQDTLIDELISSIVAGEKLVTLAHAEAAARGDRDWCQTKAVPVGSEWGLSGAKSLVLGGTAANHLLISAMTDSGLALFLLEQQTPGLQRHDYRLIDNHRACDLVLKDVVAPRPIAIGQAAQDAIYAGLDHGLIGLCAEAVGLMDLAVTTTRDYLRTRQQFGTTLNTFQALQHRMADMLVELELSRSILFGALSVMDLDASQRSKPVAAMKAVVSTAAIFVGRNAVQLHGGIGITEECLVSHLYRRLFTIAGLFGGEETHLRRMART
jgi:alkylation response protein AidB-like acyl-CoA dehydrogenase